MPVQYPRLRTAPAALRGLALGAAALLAGSPGVAPCLSAESPLPGYLSYDALAQRIQALDGKSGAQVETLGKTAAGRDLLCVNIGAAGLPAIVLVGSVDASSPCCAEITLRIAERLCAKAGSDSGVDALLKSARLRIIPCPSPDAYAGLFAGPYTGSPLNLRPNDEDNDGAVDEDGPEDLDSDGWITSVRVKDGGNLMPHPLDARVLIEADRSKGEAGGWSVYTEGNDNDGDGRVNEDGPGGVDFNRNWTFLYPYFSADAGPHQVSEPETRAVADALFADNSVAVVLALGPDVNLAPLWQPSGGAEGREVKTTLLGADAPYYNRLAEVLKESVDVEGAPGPPGGEGSFVKWAYFHYGRLSLCVNPWWPPKPAPEEKKEEAQASTTSPEDSSTSGSPAAGSDGAEADGVTPENIVAASYSSPPQDETKWDENDKRGQADRDLLSWYEQNGIDGFQPWKRIEHPDYPGLEVEVGGFRPLLRQNPPAAELDGIADKQLAFLTALGGMLPRLEIRQVQVEPLGDGVYRLKARFANSGFLPTMSAMGDLSRIPFPLQVKLSLPDGASLLAGLARQRTARLEGGAVGEELSWLIFAPQGGTVGISIGSPMVGRAETTLKLEGD